jgi:hypothetical protein
LKTFGTFEFDQRIPTFCETFNVFRLND